MICMKCPSALPRILGLYIMYKHAPAALGSLVTFPLSGRSARNVRAQDESLGEQRYTGKIVAKGND